MLSPRRFFLALAIAALLGGCGGNVVSEPTGGQSESSTGDGGHGATSSVGSGAAGAQGGAASSSSQTSSSSGPGNPCEGQACGVPCTTCTASECWRGFCGQYGTCEMVGEACLEVGTMAPCPAPEEAGFQLCSYCMGGKGCSFLGCVVSGPRGGEGTCCYQVVGGCVPNP